MRVQMPNTEVHREWRRSLDVADRRASSMKQLNFDAVTSPQPKQGAPTAELIALLPCDFDVRSAPFQWCCDGTCRERLLSACLPVVFVWRACGKSHAYACLRRCGGSRANSSPGAADAGARVTEQPDDARRPR